MPISEIHDIPHPLGLSGESGSGYTNTPGVDADYNIAGIEFLTAASDDYPYQRKMAQMQKDQFDNSDNPGDNSLQGWWLRTQTDWSMGAGQEVMEPISDDNVSRGYNSSAGVDVFTRLGYATCLPAAAEVESWVSGSVPVIVETPTGFIIAVGTTVERWVAGVLDATVTAAGTVTGLTIAGANVLIASINNIEYAPLTGTFTIASGFTCTGTPNVWFVKSRILIAVGDKIYESPGSVFTPIVALTTALYDLKDASLAVTGVTTTPNSILLSTTSNSGSKIWALALDTAGTLPITTAPVIIAEFPSNESVYDITSYLGTYVGIATSRGARVATITQNGGLSYGPLLGSPVPSNLRVQFSAYDRFLHYPVSDAGDGRSGLVRIDLSELQQDGRCPWSTFLRVPLADTNDVVGQIITGERSALLLTTSAPTLYEVDDANGLDAGWLQCSSVRYGTLETKQYQTVKVITESPLTGSVQVSTISPEGDVDSIGTITAAMGTEALLRVNAPKAWTSMGVKLVLTPAVGGATGPTLAAWQLKAYPAVQERGEIVLLPLLNYDLEKDAHGVTVGYEGRAWKRYKALRDRIALGTNMLVKELNSGATYVAVAEDMSFSQVDPGNEESGFGGVISLVLRTV